MKFKLIIIVALAVLIISIGTVSADENTTDDETLKLDSTPCEILGIDTNDSVLTVGEDSFTSLQNTIDSAAPEDNITLEGDYVYNTGFSTDGVSITKSLTIDGNGHTIDTDSQSRAFTIAADNVVLKNLQIIGSGNAGAVTITGSNVVIDNVTFNTSNSTGNGGAVYSTGANTGIYYSTFIACVSANGGALYLGDSSTVSKSKFINCTASNSAGAIYINALCNVSNCIFDHNSALNGGDVYVAASECGLIVSNFTGSYADAKGGAVFIGNAGFNIISCQFTSCVAYEDGGAVHMSNGSSGSVMTCTFTECIADNGGAVHFMGEECEISDTIFTECLAEYGDGGAVYANGKANATGSVFTNNFADGFGGAIYNCMHSDCVFESNTEPEIYFDEEFRENLTMTIDVSDASFGEDIIVLVHVKPSVSLNATADISGTIKVFEIVNGTGILNISGLNAGAYILTVTVNSTMEYNSFSNSTMFSVMKVQPVIEIIANDIYYGDDAAILVNLPDEATGMVELYVNGAMFGNFTIIAGKASTVIPGLEVGIYDVTASYAGDLNYNGCSNNATFKVMHNTFLQLQTIIDDDTTGEITLDRDYCGEGSEIAISKTITINGNGHTLDAKGLSRIFTIAADNVVLKDLSIINSGSGGAVTITGNNVVLDNVTFNGCHSTGNGGAVHSTGKNTLILNSAFIGCDSASGGALYLGNTATVSGSQFINCSSDNDAGAIHINAACNISNCLFDHNIAVEGGDIYLAGSPCNIIACNFTGSRASGNGGAVRTMNVIFTIMDCQFISCVSQQNGGAVYMGPNSSGSIMACTFTGDRAVNGGAVHMSNGSSGSVMTCNFTECTADGDGGAVHFMGEECEISDTIFTECTADGDGGAVHFMGEECEISYTIFTECTAEYGDGGAVYANGKANATGSVFTNNVADNLGGAIYNCMHSDCEFESNTEPEIYFDEEFRQNLTMNITASNVNFGEDITVLVHVEPSVSLNATAVISGTAVISDTIMVVEIVNGTGILNISGLNAGAYVLTVTVNSTMEYNSCSNSTMFSVMKVPPVIEIIANDIYYGDDAAILVNLPDGATGMVELYVNGAVINFTINDEGKPSTIISGLEAGTYYVTASYTGDLNYNDCSNTTTFKVMHNTFLQLQTIIDDDTTGEITLDRDYYGEGSEITISKSITINGNGHTLDAKGQSRIFNVQSGTVVLDNLSLVNGNSDSYGGAAYFQSGSTCTVRNCNFTGNTAKNDGGAVYFYEPGTVTNSTFTANSAKKGGAIYSNGNTDTVNSTFIDNSADLGGAIYNCDHEICTFTGNSQPDFYFDEQYRKNVTMTVNAEEIMMGEDLTVIIIFDQDITGNVTVNIDGVDMDVPIVNRTGNLLVHGLSAGHHNLTASFNGNFEYRQCNVMMDVTVLEKKVSVIIETVNIQFGDVETVNVQLNESIEGIVTVEITKRGSYLANGTVMGNNFSMNYTITLINGSASLSIPDLTVGEYTATVHYPGDGNYSEANATINFTVSKRDLNVLVDFSNEDKTITFTPQANVAYVSVEIAGNIYEIEANVSTTIYLNDLASGNYTYIITYPGDDAYNPYTSSANITISRLPVNVTVNADNITYGQTQNVTAIVPDGATSMVNFILSRDEQIIANTTSPVVNGVASYEIPQLNAGTYLLRASYLGDSKYEASSFYEKRFKVDPNIDVSPKVKIGDDGKIVIEVGDITGRISVFVDDAEDGSRSINNKKFTYYLVTEDYSVGYHNLTFEYIGSDLDENVFKKWDSGAQKYLPVKYLINITQRPTETVLDSDSDQMFVVVLEDDDGKLLSNATGNVTFTILDEYANVVAEEVVCVVNGIATLDISKYKNGNYVIQWNYSGDEKHTPITRQVSLSIIHKASRINAGDVKIIYTQSGWYSVTLYGNDGKPLSNALVEFLIGNKVIGRVNTNANGVAGVSISSNPGTYSLSIKAPGKTVTKKLTVEHIISLKTVKIKRSAKKLVLTATLKKVNGKYLKGKKVTFKFNGKKYSAKTNKKGVAKVTIKKNVLKKLKKGKKVTYQATYLKDTVKKKSKVKK